MLNKLKVKNALHFFSRIVTSIPGPKDTWAQKIVKSLSVVDTIYSYTKTYNPVEEFIKDNNLTKTHNGVLVDLFFSTSMKDLFKISKSELDGPYLGAVKAESEELGTLYFTEWRWSTSAEPIKEGLILHEEGYDFVRLLNKFWDLYDGKLYIKFSLNGATCSEFPVNKSHIYGKSIEKVRDISVEHMKYVRDGVSRTYLFLGKPGAGKSSSALNFSLKMGKRVLKLDASALASAGKSLRFILGILAPDFLLIDDIDKESTVTEHLSDVLSTMEWLKTSNPNVTIVFTASATKDIDAAFWRPGRVDQIFPFEEPDAKDREAILKGYFEEFQVPVPRGYSVKRIAKATEGMSPAWLREIILRFKYAEPKQVLTISREMFEIVHPESKKKREETEKQKKVEKKVVLKKGRQPGLTNGQSKNGQSKPLAN